MIGVEIHDIDAWWRARKAARRVDSGTPVWYTPIVLGYIERDGAVLLTRRPPGVHQAGAWEFPGGKVEPGETPQDALRRELREELGVDVTVGDELAAVRYRYPDRAVELRLFRCTLHAGEPAPRAADALCWTPRDTLATVAFPPANAALLKQIHTGSAGISTVGRRRR